MHEKVLVTGATGFVGRAVAGRLLAGGYRVHGLARPSSDTSHPKALEGDLVVRLGDIGDPDSLAAAMRDEEGAPCDWVIHCAGLNAFWQADRGRYQALNVEGTRHVMEAALSVGVSKVVQVSTAMAYGYPAASPFDEESAPGPHRSAYARSKHEGDRIAWQLHREQGLPLVVVYLAAVVGPGDPKTVMEVRRFVQGRLPLMIDSPHRFTYVAIGDAAEAIVRAAEKPGNAGERYLVGKERLTTRAYFQIMSDLSGVPMPRHAIGRRASLWLASLLTGWAVVTGRPPLMPLDLMRTVYERSLIFDGRKAERELGLVYTPVRSALAAAIAEVEGRVGH